MPTSDCITTSSCICTCTVLMKRKHQNEFMIIYCMYICGICMYISVVLCVCHTSLHLQSFGLCVKGGKCMWGILDMWVIWQLLAKCRVLTKSVAKWFPAALSRSLCPVRCSYVYITDITVYHIIYDYIGNSIKLTPLSLSLPPSSSAFLKATAKLSHYYRLSCNWPT